MACGAALSAFSAALGGGVRRRGSPRVRSRTPGRPTPVRCAYGESRKDGTWIEKPQNTFGKLINVAKGQREIVQAGTPCLREIAEEIPPQDIGSAKIQELIQEMLSICRGRGVGLAAPQIGVPYRLFVMMDDAEGMSDVSPEDLATRERTPFDQKVVINPIVTPAGNASALFFEGCLSVQGYRGLVRRWLAVRVQGLGGDGAPVDFVARGWQARIAQHEMDHLNGVLYVDRMDTRTFRRVDKLNERMPPAHPEFGAAPEEGVYATTKSSDDGVRDANGKQKWSAGVSGADDVEGFIGKGRKSSSGKKRRSR
jgi:peptide deformylase